MIVQTVVHTLATCLLMVLVKKFAIRMHNMDYYRRVPPTFLGNRWSLYEIQLLTNKIVVG